MKLRELDTSIGELLLTNREWPTEPLPIGDRWGIQQTPVNRERPTEPRLIGDRCGIQQTPFDHRPGIGGTWLRHWQPLRQIRRDRVPTYKISREYKIEISPSRPQWSPPDRYRPIPPAWVEPPILALPPALGIAGAAGSARAPQTPVSAPTRLDLEVKRPGR